MAKFTSEEMRLHLLTYAKVIRDYCAENIEHEEECPFFRGYNKVEKNGYVVKCELSKGECSPQNWELEKEK